MIVDNRFRVEIIKQGENYGRNNVLTHEKEDPLVEFWDTQYEQFVSRYYLSTLLERDYGGLNLQGDVPAWSVSSEGMDRVREMLRKVKEEL